MDTSRRCEADRSGRMGTAGTPAHWIIQQDEPKSNHLVILSIQVSRERLRCNLT